MITELFALPINLKHVATVGNQKLYGSDSLNKNFIEAISGSKNLSPIVKTVDKLVSNKKIIPIFANKDIIGYYSDAINNIGKGYIHSKHIMAFFMPDAKCIFVLIDNNTNILWYANNDELSKLVTHELMHMVANFKPSLFIVTFKNELLIFYKDLFSSIFKLKDEKKLDLEIENIYKSLFNSIETSFEIDFKKFKIEMDKLKKYSTLKSGEFDKVLLDYFRILKFHFSEQYDMIFKEEYKYILREPYYVYRRNFKFFPIEKNCVQELGIPSEVISTIAEYKPTSKFYKAIRTLAA